MGGHAHAGSDMQKNHKPLILTAQASGSVAKTAHHKGKPQAPEKGDFAVQMKVTRRISTSPSAATAKKFGNTIHAFRNVLHSRELLARF